MQPNSEAWATFLQWMEERMNIFWKRLDGEDPPWSDDWILNTYKFTNVYRVLDRTTQYLLKNVQYNQDWNEEDVIFRTLFFKMFNMPSTWEAVLKRVGDENMTYQNFVSEKIENELLFALDIIWGDGETIYSPAYMMTGSRSVFGHPEKHRNHYEAMQYWFRKKYLVNEIMQYADKTNGEYLNGYNAIVKILQEQYYVGPFLAMQFATDLNYSSIVNFSENDYIIAGPGAVRGLYKLLPNISNKQDKSVLIEAVREMLLEEHRNSETWRFASLPGRFPSLMDVQNVCCEFDKYMRAYDPSVKSNRKRIKNYFMPTGEIEKPFFPPKWNIEEI